MTGPEIHKRRLDLGLSRQELATLAGIDTASLWAIETGAVKQPRKATLAAIRQALESAEGKEDA